MIRLQFMLLKYFNNLCDYVTMLAAFFLHRKGHDRIL